MSIAGQFVQSLFFYDTSIVSFKYLVLLLCCKLFVTGSYLNIIKALLNRLIAVFVIV